MPKAKKLNIVIEQGDEFNFLVSVKKDGAAFNLTGYTMGAELRDKIGGDLLAAFTVVIEGAASLGKIRWTMPEAITSALVRGGEYDLRIKSAGGVPIRLLQGTATFRKEVTTTL